MLLSLVSGSSAPIAINPYEYVASNTNLILQKYAADYWNMAENEVSLKSLPTSSSLPTSPSTDISVSAPALALTPTVIQLSKRHAAQICQLIATILHLQGNIKFIKLSSIEVVALFDLPGPQNMTSCHNSLDQFCISFANKHLQNFIQRCLFEGISHFVPSVPAFIKLSVFIFSHHGYNHLVLTPPSNSWHTPSLKSIGGLHDSPTTPDMLLPSYLSFMSTVSSAPPPPGIEEYTD
ncbi:hypothetical protein OG21DRAFT_1488312 [Imleria badia]|nr:hypothetical protein OG21DRAFT_1488312 [Imleria badia]